MFSSKRCYVDTNVQSLVTQDIGVVDRDIQAPERNMFLSGATTVMSCATRD